MAKLSTLTKTLAHKAVQKPATLKPFTKRATSRIIKALITSKNRPKVMNVNGNVNTTKNGLTMALAKPSNTADTNNAPVLANLMP